MLQIYVRTFPHHNRHTLKLGVWEHHSKQFDIARGLAAKLPILSKVSIDQGTDRSEKHVIIYIYNF